MSSDTLKTKAVYGKKAYVIHDIIPSSTFASVNSTIEISMSFYDSGNCIDSGFRKVDISDKQKKNTYRRINKMLGGC